MSRRPVATAQPGAHLSPSSHAPTHFALWIPSEKCSKLHSDPKEEDSSEDNSQHSSEDRSESVDKDASTSSEVTIDSINLPHSEEGKAKVKVFDSPASKMIIIIIIKI